MLPSTIVSIWNRNCRCRTADDEAGMLKAWKISSKLHFAAPQGFNAMDKYKQQQDCPIRLLFGVQVKGQCTEVSLGESS